jgi:hypothetical protein
MKKAKKAFSIFELILVLAIMILVFSVSVPKKSFINRFLLENEVDKLFTVFSFLQQRAIASNQEQEITFDLVQNTYFYDLADTSKQDLKMSAKPVFCKLPEAVKFGFLQGTNGPPSSPGRPITCPITFKQVGQGKFKVAFFTDGKIQPGTAYFIDKNHNFMMALTCPISQVSFIRKYKYDKNKWICLK